MSSPLAVVPVMVNAGAAIFPALLAAVGSIIGLLFRPRELVRACRRRPITAAAVLACLLLAGALLYFHWNSPQKTLAAIPKTSIDFLALAHERERELLSPHEILQPLWTNPLDGDMALATPALFTSAAGPAILYQPGVDAAQAEKLPGTFYALDAATGKKIWKANTVSDGSAPPVDLRAIFSQPVIAHNGAWVITGQGLHDDANCALLCIDVDASRLANAGRTAWTVPTTLHLESSPSLFTVHGKPRVVIGAGAIEGPDGKAISDPGYLICVDVDSGKLLWTYHINDPEAASVVDQYNIIYVGAGVNGNAVVALRSDTDAELAAQKLPREVWRLPTQYPATGDLCLVHDAILGDLLLLGAGNGDYVHSAKEPAGLVLAINPATGKILWQTQVPDSVLGRLAVQGQMVLAPCRDGNVYALDLAKGQILWKTRISETGENAVLAGIVTNDRYAFALSADATLAALSLSNGQIIERLKLNDPAKFTQNYTMAKPLLAGDNLYVPTENTGLHAFNIGR